MSSDSMNRYTNVGNAYYVGGLVGMNDGSVQNCFVYASTSIKGGIGTGGAVGGNASTATLKYVYAWPNQVYSTYTDYSGIFCGLNNNVNNTVQCYVVATSDIGISQNGGMRIMSDSLTTSATFQSYATQWDWDDVWVYNTNNLPILYDCGNLGAHETIEYTKPSKEYTVTFNSGSANKAEFAKVADKTVTAADGTSGTVTLPAAPEKESGDWVYDFQGWSDGDTVYETGDEITVTGDVELTAVWQLHSIDGDGDWDIDDAKAIMSMRKGESQFADEQKVIADINGDEKIDYRDAMCIMDKLAAGELN
jgi:hypothetical protein